MMMCYVKLVFVCARNRVRKKFAPSEPGRKSLSSFTQKVNITQFFLF